MQLPHFFQLQGLEFIIRMWVWCIILQLQVEWHLERYLNLQTMQPKSNLLDERVTLKVLWNDSMSLANDPTKGSSIHVEDFL